MGESNTAECAANICNSFTRSKNIHTHTHDNKLPAAARLCVPVNTNLSAESKNLTYFQRPDSLCCSSPLTD